MKLKNKLMKIALPVSIMAMSVPVWAADDAVQTAMTAGMNQVKTDTLAMVGTAVPIAMGIMATFLAIKKGIGFFKSLVNKAG